MVGELDISPIEEAIRRKDARGQRPYDPQMMVARLVYAYCTGVYSSRRMERACHENVAFRVITGNRQPYFTTINDFRRVHRKHFEALFVEVLKLCREAGLVKLCREAGLVKLCRKAGLVNVKLRHVAVDGTKVKANASKHKAMSYARLVAEEKRLRREVRRMLAEAEAVDGAENARHGEGVRGDELPDELRRRESRLDRLREAEARKARARALREQAEGGRAGSAGGGSGGRGGGGGRVRRAAPQGDADDDRGSAGGRGAGELHRSREQHHEGCGRVRAGIQRAVGGGRRDAGDRGAGRDGPAAGQREPGADDRARGGSSGRDAGERDGRRGILEPGGGGRGAGAGDRVLGLDGAAASIYI
ncbi:MAG: transposase [Gemmatimonadota bacterium]|nr:transposase [Gemmatimonadota bacterium]MDE2872486.1 transposase [Gemmatimonadota bacterium]